MNAARTNKTRNVPNYFRYLNRPAFGATHQHATGGAKTHGMYPEPGGRDGARRRKAPNSLVRPDPRNRATSMSPPDRFSLENPLTSLDALFDADATARSRPLELWKLKWAQDDYGMLHMVGATTTGESIVPRERRT